MDQEVMLLNIVVELMMVVENIVVEFVVELDLLVH
jgi:hypothetical protein